MARFHCAILASLGVFIKLVTSQHCITRLVHKLGRSILIYISDERRAASTTSTEANVSQDPDISSTAGPFLGAYSYTWSQYIVPTTVGTVLVVVNNATNQTSTTTIYHTEFERNGSMTLLTRTDTNTAGTVTNAVLDYNRRRVTM